MKKYTGIFIIFTIIITVFTLQTSASQTVRAVIMTEDVGCVEGVITELKILDPKSEIVYIYTQIPGGGFAADVDSGVLEKIKKIEGVRNAYISPVIKGKYAEDAEALPGIVIAPQTEYRGEGMVVAVIDVEFYTGHELFVLSPDTVPRLTKDNIELTNLNINITKVPYISEKIPFSYDYLRKSATIRRAAEDGLVHGTHVAGIIGANKLGSPEDGFDGMVPEAQLVFMKVGDEKGYIDFSAAIAAINDAIMLKVDVINLSWGSDAGFSNPAADADYYAILTMAQTQGIDVAVSAGNIPRIGEMSTFYKNYGICDPLSTNPDNGLVAAPSTLDPVLSVASYNSEFIGIKGYIESSKGETIIYSEAYHIFASQIIKKGPKFEYTDTNSGIYKNKLVLTKGLSEEDMNYLKKEGAIGIIYYGEDPLLAVKSAILPVAYISRQDAEKLLGAEDYVLTVHEYDTLQAVENPKAGKISYFSSWGPTPSLNIKPDITAVGGNVYSTSAVKKYESMSGTSMSAPMVTGALAAVKQYMQTTEMYDVTNYTARQLIMSAAQPIIDPDTGTEYSPRRQGAGLLNLENALKTNVLLYNVETKLPKIELGDNLSNVITFDFNVKNFSNIDETFKLDVSVLTDGSYHDKTAKRYFISEHSAALKKVKYDKETITVPAMSTITVTVEITLDVPELRALSKIFTQGFYIEGFVYLNGDIPLSIPFMGFYGDWDSVKIFDNDFYTQMLGTKIMYNDVFYDILLGANVFMDDDDINPLLYAFSPDGDGYGDVLSFCSQAVRNYILKGFQITDARGNIIASGKADTFNPKSYAVDSHLLTFVDDVWDGRDNNNLRYIYPDGKYYLTVFAVSAYNGSSVQSHTIPFYIDTQKPKITNVSVHGNKLSISASDNLAIQSVGVYNNETYDELVLFGSMTATSNVTVEFDITGVTGFIYIELIDYAMNLYTVRVSV